MYNATAYFKNLLDRAIEEAVNTEDSEAFVEWLNDIRYLKLAIYALERLEEQDANK